MLVLGPDRILLVGPQAADDALLIGGGVAGASDQTMGAGVTPCRAAASSTSGEQPRQMLGLLLFTQPHLVQPQVDQRAAQEREPFVIDRAQQRIGALVADVQVRLADMRPDALVVLLETAADQVGIMDALGRRVAQRLDLGDDLDAIARAIVNHLGHLLHAQRIAVGRAEGLVR